MRRKIEHRLPDLGIGFFCLDMVDENLDMIMFRVLPLEVVQSICEMILSMKICSKCEITTSTDSYRAAFVAERIEARMYGFDRRRTTEAYLKNLCMEVAFAKGYELYDMCIDDLLNLKARTAFDKRKRYI